MGICCHSKLAKENNSIVEISTHSEPKVEEITVLAIAIALFSLIPNDESILQIAKGDKLIIEDDSDPDWTLVRHVKNQKRGFVPKTYIALDTAAAEEEWFFSDANRGDAERLLLQPENIPGTFMIRNSRMPGIYALSIKEIIPDTNEITVRHYKIKTLDDGGFFISKEPTFATLQQLVSYYKESSNGLCRKLEKACPRPRPIITGPLPAVRDEYEIPYSSLQFIRLLGKGNFGEVFYGFWNKTLEVAIKCLGSSGVQTDEFRREVSVMKAIRHPQIVRLFAISTEREPFCIVMEYMCHGNLQEYLRSNHGKQLKLPSLVNMASQISDGMKYLESKNLIHRDLAARNILVGEGDIVKLADFGLARILDEEVYVASGGKLPIKWTAPEAYALGKFTIKSDIWSFGIVLYEIFSHGGAPYEGMKNSHVLQILKQNYRLPKPSDPECSDPVYETMLLCWKTNPDDRPTFEYLFHFFTDYYISSEKSYKEAE